MLREGFFLLVFISILTTCMSPFLGCSDNESEMNHIDNQTITSGSHTFIHDNEENPMNGITITSPLVIHLWRGPIDNDIDYTENPIQVNGIVSHPEATVTVNGDTVNVAIDGSFSHELQLDSGSGDTITTITATATLGSQKDNWIMSVGLTQDGKILTVPGMGSGGHRYEPRIIHRENVDIRVGEVVTVDVTLESGKKTQPYYPSEFFYSIENPFSSDGLEVTIEPDRFMAYANSSYHSVLTINAPNEVVPGEYNIKLHHHGATIGFTHININVIR